MKNYSGLKIGDRVRTPPGNLETLQEIENPELYKDNIKKNCVGCGAAIPGDWPWYRHHGNWCQECSVKAEKNTKNKRYT